MNFAFPEQPSKDSASAERRLRLQEIRDGQAALLLAAALQLRCPFVFVNNIYPPGYSFDQQEKEIVQGCAGIKTILMSTRPPLDDALAASTGTGIGNGNRRRIKRSGNWLECRILEKLRALFKFCDRKTIELDPAVIRAEASKLKFHFQQSDEAFVVPRRPSKDGTSGPPKDWTVAYFVRGGALWPGGPDLVCGFGLSGPMTLLWCYLLANRAECAERIRGPESRFIMARIRLERPIPAEPHFLSFSDDWGIDFLVDQIIP